MDRMCDLASCCCLGRTDRGVLSAVQNVRTACPLYSGNRPVGDIERVVIAENVRVLADAHVVALEVRVAVQDTAWTS